MSIDEITNQVIAKISERFFLVEKTFDVKKDVRNVKAELFIECVISHVCKHFYIGKETLIAKRRGLINKDYSYPQLRYMFMHLCKKIPDGHLTLSQIGQAINMDHAGVIHGLKQCEDYLADPRFRHDYDLIKAKIVNDIKHTI